MSNNLKFICEFLKGQSRILVLYKEFLRPTQTRNLFQVMNFINDYLVKNRANLDKDF